MRITSTGVGIGTTDPVGYKLNVNGTTFFNWIIYNNERYRVNDNFPCNKINLYGTNNIYGFGIDSGTLDYFTNTTHTWYDGSSGTNFGTVGMTLTNNNLNVGSINTNSIVSSGTSGSLRP
jgi:hypothetical protein